MCVVVVTLTRAIDLRVNGFIDLTPFHGRVRLSRPL